jgi:hypothetical protein
LLWCQGVARHRKFRPELVVWGVTGSLGTKKGL